MAAETNIKGQNGITVLDTAPLVPVSAGIGAAGRSFEVDDWCPVAATPIQSAGSYYRVVRIPANAIVKNVQFATDRALDSGTPTLALDIGIAWSDSTVDGTPAKYQGLIPTTANDGTTTTFASYSSPNKIFGGISAATLTNSAKYMSGNLLFNGITSGYSMDKIASNPLWNIFGYVDGRGLAYCPGGMMDIYVYATTGANTGVAGKLWVRCNFVL